MRIVRRLAVTNGTREEFGCSPRSYVLGTDASARSLVDPRDRQLSRRLSVTNGRRGVLRFLGRRHGPAPTSPLSFRERVGGEGRQSVAARIVDCTPRRRTEDDDAPTSCQDFAASVPATRGLIAAPWTPASHLLCSRGKTGWRRFWFAALSWRFAAMRH